MQVCEDYPVLLWPDPWIHVDGARESLLISDNAAARPAGACYTNSRADKGLSCILHTSALMHISKRKHRQHCPVLIAAPCSQAVLVADACVLLLCKLGLRNYRQAQGRPLKKNLVEPQREVKKSNHIFAVVMCTVQANVNNKPCRRISGTKCPPGQPW
jgi:hypothetical protein